MRHQSPGEALLHRLYLDQTSSYDPTAMYLPDLDVSIVLLML